MFGYDSIAQRAVLKHIPKFQVRLFGDPPTQAAIRSVLVQNGELILWSDPERDLVVGLIEVRQRSVRHATFSLCFQPLTGALAKGVADVHVLPSASREGVLQTSRLLQLDPTELVVTVVLRVNGVSRLDAKNRCAVRRR